MPVRSLNSAVFKWPDAASVIDSARRWAADVARRDASVRRVAVIGSYARGDHGVGSDLDLLVITRDSPASPTERYCRYCPDDLPTPADVLVYTEAEWDGLARDRPGLHRRLADEALWLIPESEGSPRT